MRISDLTGHILCREYLFKSKQNSQVGVALVIILCLHEIILDGVSCQRNSVAVCSSSLLRRFLLLLLKREKKKAVNILFYGANKYTEGTVVKCFMFVRDFRFAKNVIIHLKLPSKIAKENNIKAFDLFFECNCFLNLKHTA